MSPVVARGGVDEDEGEQPKSVELHGESEVALGGGGEAQLRGERVERVALGVLDAAPDGHVEADERSARERRMRLGESASASAASSARRRANRGYVRTRSTQCSEQAAARCTIE